MKLLNSGIGKPEAGAAVQRRRATRETVRICAEKITAFYAMFHDFPHFYAQIRAVFTRFYALLRVRLFFRRLAIFEQAAGVASLVCGPPFGFYF
jgi:hypothetical protein